MKVRLALLLLVTTLVTVLPAAERVEFKDRCLRDLVAQAPAILASQDKRTGRFGEGIWVVNDQHAMLPLAALWATRAEGNPYYRSADLLTAVMAAGDALIADQDASGKWEFRKKDGSTWGAIYMPWTYSRWIRTFCLVRDAMPAPRRAAWERALRLGYTGIARELAGGRLHNIPAHHAMGLYFAAQALGEPSWSGQARDFLRRIAAHQHPDGYWSENAGPVVLYGTVYVEALGIYYAASGDREVLPALERAARFHAYFTYPDGSDVETIDERNAYHEGVRVPNAGFPQTPEGRAYTARQLRLHGKPLPWDEAAALLLWGSEGEAAGFDPAGADFDYALPGGGAAVRRRGPWTLVASAFTAPVPKSRWQQDRQNFLSVFHDRAGLILGGGNTKLQPRWSTFTRGDLSLLSHRPGDQNPDFLPPPGLRHVPSAARLLTGDDFGVELDYGGVLGRVTVRVRDVGRAEVTWHAAPELQGHVTVLPSPAAPLRIDGKNWDRLEAAPFPIESGVTRWLEHAGFRLEFPLAATLVWPALPHNPYRKDGHAEPAEGRLVIDLPRGGAHTIVVRTP